MTGTAKSINPAYYPWSPVLNLKEKVERRKLGFLGMLWSLYQFLLSVRIKAPWSLASSIRPWRINFPPCMETLCGKTDYTERDSDPRRSTVSVQFAMLDAQLVRLGDLYGHLPFLSHHSPLSLQSPMTIWGGQVRERYKQPSREVVMATIQFNYLINICKSYI